MKLTCLFSLGCLEDLHLMCRVSVSQGYRVGSEFWSLPPRFGDELSGITSTLTQTEQGKQKAVTRVAQPRSIRQETGTQPSAPSSCSFWVYICPRHSIHPISGSCFNLRLIALSLVSFPSARNIQCGDSASSHSILGPERLPAEKTPGGPGSSEGKRHQKASK